MPGFGRFNVRQTSTASTDDDVLLQQYVEGRTQLLGELDAMW